MEDSFDFSESGLKFPDIPDVTEEAGVGPECLFCEDTCTVCECGDMLKQLSVQ